MGNPRPVQVGCTGERARRNPTSCPESWSVGVPFNLKPRSFVSTAFQRIASTQPTYIPTKTRTGLLEKQFTKPPMILQCWGLSQAVLSAPSDNHPAGPTGLIAGVLIDDPKHLSQALTPQDPSLILPQK